jgi:VWFA-related protein
MPSVRSTSLISAVVFVLTAFSAAQLTFATQEFFSPGTHALRSNITINKRVDEVNLAFTIMNKKGKFIQDLGPSDFEVLDNHIPTEQFRLFQQQTELPLRVGLLIDASDSVRARFRFEQMAAVMFLKKMLRPERDRAFIATFNDSVHLIADLSSNVPYMQKTIKHAKDGGNTSLYDAVIFACNKLNNNSEDVVTRKVIILISDGVDTKSTSLMADAQQAAVHSEALLLALSTNDLSLERYPTGEAVLDLLSKPTGGYILPAHEDWQLAGAFSKIERALRSQYFIAYNPPNFKPDGSYRSIDLVLKNPKLKVRCRTGYYARRETTHF